MEPMVGGGLCDAFLRSLLASDSYISLELISVASLHAKGGGEGSV